MKVIASPAPTSTRAATAVGTSSASASTSCPAAMVSAPARISRREPNRSSATPTGICSAGVDGELQHEEQRDGRGAGGEPLLRLDGGDARARSGGRRRRRRRAGRPPTPRRRGRRPGRARPEGRRRHLEDDAAAGRTSGRGGEFGHRRPRGESPGLGHPSRTTIAGRLAGAPRGQEQPRPSSGAPACRADQRERPTRGAPSMASVIHFSIATEAEKSPDFRRVLWTGEHSQLVIMTIPPGGEIGEEVHEDTDQILTFVSGTGEATVSGTKKQVAQGDLVVVPAGKKHNFVNTGPNPLILYTVYGPPEHADGAVHKTKEEADAAGGGRQGRAAGRVSRAGGASDRWPRPVPGPRVAPRPMAAPAGHGRRSPHDLAGFSPREPRERLHLRRPAAEVRPGRRRRDRLRPQPHRRQAGAGRHRPRRGRHRAPAAGGRPDGAVRHRGAGVRRRARRADRREPGAGDRLRPRHRARGTRSSPSAAARASTPPRPSTC